ncbi:MAG: peptidoglycan DD-metalloendopeptidase family protein [Spirochaetales bacterium]|nr:peptidoglycan DD-metalloendopeptidase family protein [Spirochaetales bacterium]
MSKRKLLTVSVYLAAALLAFFSFFGVIYSAWPELSDSDLPVLTLEGVSDGGSYTGVISVTFSANDATAGIGRVRIRIDDADVYDKAIGAKSWFDGSEIDTSGLREGEHRLTATVTDSSLWRLKREVAVAFTIDRTPPRLSVSSFKTTVLQGDTDGLVISVNEKLSTLKVEALGDSIVCHSLPGAENRFRALFGVSPLAKPAVYKVQCVARDLAGNVTSESVLVTVAAKKFPFEVIHLPKEKQGILHNTAKITEDREIVAAALASAGDVQLWRGTFDRPAPGIDSSPFGIRRVYETGGTASYHQGIDIANKEGTPIAASNAGAVLFAGKLYVPGNTVILDHGQGVVSSYYHMKALGVKKGDVVAKGTVIGWMGTTGLSTGNHCHWQITVGGQCVNPDDWRQFSYETEDE